MSTLLEQLQQLAPLAAQATAGPWVAKSSIPHIHNEEATHSVQGPESDWFFLTYQADAAFIAAARNMLTPENLALIIGLLGNMDSVMDTNRVLANRLLMYEKALHAAEQNMTDVVHYYGTGCSMQVLDEAVRDMKNDGLKLVKAARKNEARR